MDRQTQKRNYRAHKASAKAELTINAVNMLSIKPVLIFSAYASKMLAPVNESTKRLSRNVAKLKRLASQMQSGDLEMYGRIGNALSSCVKNYVDMFYEADREVLNRYISECLDGLIGKNNNGIDNMLIFPALMANMDKPREEAYETIISEIRRKPTSFIARYSRRAVEITRYMAARGMANNKDAQEHETVELMDSIIDLLQETDMGADYSRIANGNADIIRQMERMDNKHIINLLQSALMPIESNPSRIRRK